MFRDAATFFAVSHETCPAPSIQETSMKLLVSAAVALAFTLGAGSALAADTAKPLTPQQQRMKDCNAQAGNKKGDERKTFMSTCLKGGAAAPAKMTQQEKMKACNADATKQKLTGDKRKSYMSTCLKGDGAAAH
jgi:hypothetical protein